MDLRDNKISCEDLDDDTKALLSEIKSSQTVMIQN